MVLGSVSEHKALQFGNEGVKVDLPWPASVVKINLATFDTPLRITALGETGGVIDEKNITREDSLCTVILSGKTIMSIRVTGGGNLGLLNQLSIVI